MAFEREDTFAKIADIIAKIVKADTSKIVDSATLKDLGADSLDIMKIIMKVEEVFGIEVDDEKAETLHNVSDVVNYVHSVRKK